MSSVNFERSLASWNGSAHSSTDDMALKVFSGMVLEAFQQSTMFYDRASTFISVKQIEGANAAQWPILGDDPVPSYPTAGTVLNAQATQGTNVTRLKTSSKDIVVDEILVNAIDLPFRDMEVAHFDLMAPVATKLGRAIARVLDKKIAILGVLAARASSVTNIHGGGMRVTRDSSGSGGTLLTDNTGFPLSPRGAYQFRLNLNSLAQSFEEKNVPAESRYLFITPYIKSVLRFEANWDGSSLTSVPVMPSVYDSNLSTQPNDVNNRVIGTLDGFKVIVTNHIPSTDLSSGGTAGTEDSIAANISKYRGNFSGASQANALPVALALCGADTGSPAIGMVQASGLRSYVEKDERRNTVFMKSQIMCGLDFICPWSAGAIEVF